MHVAFVLPRFFPYRGGYENSLLALSKYLVSHGHRVTVYTTVANDLEAFWLPGFKTYPEEEFSIEGVAVRRFPSPTMCGAGAPHACWGWSLTGDGRRNSGGPPSTSPDCMGRFARWMLTCFTSGRCPIPT